MWILPTKGRPNWLRRFFAAAEATRMTEPLVVCHDDEDDYEITYPKNVIQVYKMKCPDLQSVFNEAFQLHPDAAYYGLLEDDVVPRTDCWDVKMKEAAGTWNGVCCRGGFGKNAGLKLETVGGDFIRALGYLAPPKFKHYYHDSALSDLLYKMGLMIELPDVVMEHLHFSAGFRYDATYSAAFGHWIEDKARYDEWKQKDYPATLERVHIMLRKDQYDHQSAGG